MAKIDKLWQLQKLWATINELGVTVQTLNHTSKTLEGVVIYDYWEYKITFPDKTSTQAGPFDTEELALRSCIISLLK